MTRPSAAMLVIGDEILSGRTRDANAYHLAREMTRIGVDLVEIRMIADDQETIIAAVNELRARVDHLFTSGGIGPTHDDITADAVAAALGVEIGLRKDARALLEAYYRRTHREVNAARLRMARIPDGATLIENPISAAPGFTIDNVHVLAGVPEIFRAMLEGLLTQIAGGPPLLAHSLDCQIGEGDLAAPLGEVARAFPDVSMGSYPYGGGHGTILVLRSHDRARLADAVAMLRSALAPLGGAVSETPPE
ncbi:MAG TPA: molybdopterin-binding protein [Paracoccaceae bacterium]|nr:molybdopterin-binding protein [Paracoccaceae bacterium]